MAGKEQCEISIVDESHSREVERKEAGETSRGHDQPVIVASATEKGSNSSVKRKFKKLEEARGKLLKRGTAKPKIRKVEWLRDHKNFKSYCEPRVVSFGPIHHDEKKYWLTEEYKLVLADDFIKKIGKRGEDLYEMVKKNIKQLREYYDEEVTKKYNDKALAWILFVDGCATLQFIHSVVEEKVHEFKIKDRYAVFVKQDLLLLENQLPYQLLDDLMKMSKERGNLIDSILRFIDWASMLESDDLLSEKFKAMATNGEPIHLLDLLRKRLLTDNTKSAENDQSAEKETNVFNSCWGICKKNRSSIKDALFRNVQEFKAVGIYLESKRGSCLGQISFSKKWNFYPGILWLPTIIVDDSTGRKFFNLIAYEMSPDFENDFGVTSYIAFLDSLIDEAKDVMYLRKAGILRNFLGSNEEVAQLFNGICTDLVTNSEIYEDVGSKIQDYYDKKWQTWISELCNFYRTVINSRPLIIMSFTGALLGLFLTAVQSWYTYSSYQDSQK